MDMKSFHTDDAYVEDSQGKRTGPFKTKFAGSGLTFFDANFHADEGDLIIQQLPGSREKKYRVIEAQFRTGLHGIPAHYAVKVQTGAAATPAPAPSNTFNFSGANNVQIGDHNAQHITATFQTLIADIDKSNCTPSEKAEAKSKLRAFLESPVAAAVLGGLAQGLVASLGA
jgi:hypothetical protein